MFDTGYLHSWGSRVRGLNIRVNYTSSHGSRVHFPRALLAAEYGDTEIFQFVSTLAVNPYTWGYADDHLVTSELVRVAFAFVNGSYLALSGLRPAEHIELELTHGIFAFPSVRTSDDAAPSAGELDHVLAVGRSSRVELLPSESKFTLINASSLVVDRGVALAAELAAYATSQGDNSSSVVSLDVLVGYARVARRRQHDSFDAFPLTWNATSRRYELLRYLILPLQCVLRMFK